MARWTSRRGSSPSARGARRASWGVDPPASALTPLPGRGLIGSVEEMELPVGTETIRLGIALTTNPTSTKFKLREFCEALAAASGFTVTGEGLWSYQRLLEAMQAGDIDLAWLPPILALAAIERGEVRALALPVRGGVASYSTAL